MTLEYNPNSLHPRSQYRPMLGKKIDGKTVQSYFSKVAKNHTQIALYIFSAHKELSNKTFHKYTYTFEKQHNSKDNMIIIFENDNNPNEKYKIKYNEKEIYKTIAI